LISNFVLDIRVAYLVVNNHENWYRLGDGMNTLLEKISVILILIELGLGLWYNAFVFQYHTVTTALHGKCERAIKLH